jgi:tetratricopeptide (TPR) repeat protein
MQYIDLAEDVAIDPNDKIPAYRSIILRGVGRLAEAESTLVAARQIYPKSPLILSNLALAIALQRGSTEAFKYAMQAYDIDSTDVYTLSSLASLYLADGDVEKAREMFQRALKYDPQNYFTQASLDNLDQTANEMKIPSLMQKGVNYFDKALYTRARNAFREVIELDSTFVEAYMNLGFTLNLLGEPRNAIAVFAKAAELDSTQAPTYIGWGNSLAGIGNLDSAIVMYNKAIELDDSLPEAHEALEAVTQLKAQKSGEKP